jgi:hypothetical protein
MLSAFAARKVAQQAQVPFEIPISSTFPAPSSSSEEIETTTPPPSRKRKQETDRDETPRKRQKRTKEKKQDNKSRYYDQEEACTLPSSVPAAFERATREYSPSRPFGGEGDAEETGGRIDSGMLAEYASRCFTYRTF